jgi:hypothetical protein
LALSLIAEWDAKREQRRRWWSMLRADNLRFLSYSFPHGKRHIIHKSEAVGPVVISPTSFERAVEEFKLTPDQFIRSAQLREWARNNKNSKYIPEMLLDTWGFEVDSSR